MREEPLYYHEWRIRATDVDRAFNVVSRSGRLNSRQISVRRVSVLVKQTSLCLGSIPSRSVKRRVYRGKSKLAAFSPDYHVERKTV